MESKKLGKREAIWFGGERNWDWIVWSEMQFCHLKLRNRRQINISEAVSSSVNGGNSSQ